LPETELLQPVGDLLHRGSAPGLPGFISPHRTDYPTNSSRAAAAHRAVTCRTVPLPAVAGTARASDRRPGPPRSPSPEPHQRPW
jgi:hypothetical protein